DELTPLHSITSSARPRSDGRISRPSALAVLRLMTKSYVSCGYPSMARGGLCGYRSTARGVEEHAPNHGHVAYWHDADVRPCPRWGIDDWRMCAGGPLMTRMYGPAVRRKRVCRSGGCGLASMYPACDWSSAPGHHGYQRACDLISGQASMGHLGHQCSQAPGRPILHLVASSRRSRWVRSVGLGNRIAH